MGQTDSKNGTSTRKGVVYSKETKDIVGCLFCRIGSGDSSENPLWYKDDKCSVFIPRSPAAQLHLLIVPLQHIKNIGEINSDHLPLLEHMKNVALEQLRIHSENRQNTPSELRGLSPPPSDYPFNRGSLPVINSSPYIYEAKETVRDPSFVLCFHPPPFNSIDHLHLHAIQLPYRSWMNHVTFYEKAKWHMPLENVIKTLSSGQSKL